MPGFFILMNHDDAILQSGFNKTRLFLIFTSIILDTLCYTPIGDSRRPVEMGKAK